MTQLDAISISSPADALAVVPYLLGFQPRESLVLLVLERGRVVITARFDLAAAEHPKLGEHVATITGHATQPEVLLAAFSEDRQAGERALRRFADALWPTPLVDCLISDGARWARPGEALEPYDAQASVAAATAVVSGLSFVASRAQLAAQVAGPDRPELVASLSREASAWATGLPAEERRALLEEWLASPPDVARPLSEQECLRLAALVSDEAVMQSAWRAITPEVAEFHVGLWTQVVRVAVHPLELAPLCLLAAAAWAGGNGALQGVCLERAARIDPDFEPLLFLERINLAALPPCGWDRARRLVGAEDFLPLR